MACQQPAGVRSSQQGDKERAVRCSDLPWAGRRFCIMVLLLAALKEASEEFDNPRENTQQPLLARFDTQRSSSCSTSAAIHNLKKIKCGQPTKRPFIKTSAATWKRLSCPLGADDKRMSSDNGGGDLSGGRPQAGSGCAGGPGGIRCGSMTAFRLNKGRMRTVGPSPSDEKWDLAAV